MWKSIVANAWRFGTRQYIHRQRTAVSGGKIEFVETTIDNVPLQLNHGKRFLRQDKNGHTVSENYEVLIPRFFFDEQSIIPAPDDMILIDGHRYRVIAIQDIYMQPHFDIVNLTVRREEIDY